MTFKCNSRNDKYFSDWVQ